MPCHITSFSVMPCDAMPCGIMSCDIMSWYLMVCHVMSWYVMSWNVMECHVMECYIFICNITPHNNCYHLVFLFSLIAFPRFTYLCYHPSTGPVRTLYLNMSHVAHPWISKFRRFECGDGTSVLVRVTALVRLSYFILPYLILSYLTLSYLSLS